MTLRFLNVEENFDLFTCPACKSKTANDTKVMDGLVKDGSAERILEKSTPDQNTGEVG